MLLFTFIEPLNSKLLNSIDFSLGSGHKVSTRGGGGNHGGYQNKSKVFGGVHSKTVILLRGMKN